MLIDNAKIAVQAGDGGKGRVAFSSTKMTLGPTGGSGGNGGSVYFEGVSDLSALAQFRYKKEISANNGEDGKRQNNDGHDAKDVTVFVPIGTMFEIVETGRKEEILHVGERTLVAQGGHGGKGNFKFRSPTNTSPKEFQHGTPGEKFTVKLELKLIADVGLVGLPNAGKSSLLNELTHAKSKVANYPFTTLEPHLGAYYELILADIPGLIEGASEGKGLGIKFLKHIERTKTIFHLVSAESDDPVKDYKIVQNELARYSDTLAKEPAHVLLTKSDTCSAEEITKKIKALKKVADDVLPISIHDADSLNEVKKILNALKDEKLGIKK